MKELLINAQDILHNVGTIRKAIGDKTLIAVLKGNGYGLGTAELGKLLYENGVSFFAVYSTDEAKALRDAGIDADILMLPSYADEADARRLVELGCTATVGTFEAMNALVKAGQALGVLPKAHIEIDTGFGRSGFLPEDMDALIARLRAEDRLEVSGVYTHLYLASSRRPKQTDQQMATFDQCLAQLADAKIDIPMRHLGSSNVVLRMPKTHYDALRVGSALLGRLSTKGKYGLKRVGYLHSNIIEIENLPAGHNVGYGGCYTTKRDTQLAVVPIGYSDGYGLEKVRDAFGVLDTLRTLLRIRVNGALYAKWDGKPVPLLGRINMNNIQVDVTGLPAKVGDSIILECNPILVADSVKRVFQWPLASAHPTHQVGVRPS